jgi:hypothetical protein
VEGRLQQPHAGRFSFAGTLEHRNHQAPADGLVLDRRIHRDWADAGDRAPLIEEIAADDLAVLLRNHRIKAGMRQQHGENMRRDFRGGEIRRKIVLVVDGLEGLEADRSAYGGIRRCTGAQHDAHFSKSLPL